MVAVVIVVGVLVGCTLRREGGEEGGGGGDGGFGGGGDDAILKCFHSVREGGGNGIGGVMEVVLLMVGYHW